MSDGVLSGGSADLAGEALFPAPSPQVRYEMEGGQHEHGNADHPGIELRLHRPVLCRPDHDGKEQQDQETEDGLRANRHGGPDSPHAEYGETGVMFL